jgi:uncharacterized membrane protein
MLLGLVLFLGVHSVRIIAPAWREQLIGNIGEGPWKGIYSLVSLISLAMFVYGYAYAHSSAPVLYVTPFFLVHVVGVLMLISFISLMVFNLPAGRLKPLLKHPFILAVKIWAFAHLLVNGDLASIILFGSFLAWAVWARIALMRRGGALPVAGPMINDVYAIITGVLLWLLFIWKLHEWIAGVPVPFA